MYEELKNRIEKIEHILNGGAGSGNFGHAGRPGERGGSSSGGSGISKAVATQKKFQDQAKIVQEDIEDRIGQKVKKGEEYTALDEASKSRFKEFHGEDGTEYTYDKENGMITKTNPETGDQEVVTKKSGKKGTDFKSEYKVGDEFTKGGTTYKVVDGKNGPHAVSLDGKIDTTLPDQLRHEQTKMVERLFDTMRDEGIPSTSPRAVAAKETYGHIQDRAIEKARKGLEASRAPETIKTEVERFLKKIETTDASKSVESYHETSTGGLKGWAKGNGGLGKPQSTSVQSEVKELVAELDSLYDRYKIMSTPKGFRK